MLVLALAGMAIAGYLTYTHYNHAALVCTVGSCGTVQTSDYATIGPVPIAILGLGMYAAITVLSFARLTHRWLTGLQVSVAIWTLTLAGLLYALYLTYVEIWVIDAICQYCVASALVTAAIFVVESVQLWSTLDAEPDQA